MILEVLSMICLGLKLQNNIKKIITLQDTNKATKKDFYMTIKIKIINLKMRKNLNLGENLLIQHFTIKDV